MPFAQAFDEIGQADLTLPTQALGTQNRPHAFDAGIDVVVDDDVIVFGPMAHFVSGLGHTLGDNFGAVLGAGMQAAFQFAG